MPWAIQGLAWRLKVAFAFDCLGYTMVDYFGITVVAEGQIYTVSWNLYELSWAGCVPYNREHKWVWAGKGILIVFGVAFEVQK